MKQYIVFLFLLLVIGRLIAQESYEQEGFASYYADKFEGRTTANGEIYDGSKLTASHLTLPFGTYVKVINLTNNKSIVVRINDRGPFIKDRIIDVSKLGAQKLDFIEQGLVKVKIELAENPLECYKSEPIEKIDDSEKQRDKTEKNVKNDESLNPYYLFDIDIIDPSGYGIQIGSFKEMANLAKLSERIKSNYEKNVIVQVKNISEVKLYRIIIGTFSTKKEALDLIKEFKKEFPDCFVIAF